MDLEFETSILLLKKSIMKTPMKKIKELLSVQLIILTLSIIIISCSPLQKADRVANKNQQVSLFPESSFDKDLATKQLEKGKSTIRGILYVKTNKLAVIGGKAYGTAKEVELFPVNPYFMEWYHLREKKENKKTSIYMSDEAYSMRIETITDEYGRFTFTEMKPGKYFLQAFMTTDHSYYTPIATGYGSNQYGTTTYYENQRVNKVKYHRLEKFIEITKDGEIIEVKLK